MSGAVLAPTPVQGPLAFGFNGRSYETKLSPYRFFLWWSRVVTSTLMRVGGPVVLQLRAIGLFVVAVIVGVTFQRVLPNFLFDSLTSDLEQGVCDMFDDIMRQSWADLGCQGSWICYLDGHALLMVSLLFRSRRFWLAMALTLIGFCRGGGILIWWMVISAMCVV